MADEIDRGRGEEDADPVMRVRVPPACAAEMGDYNRKLWRRWKREGKPQDEGAKRGPSHAAARVLAWFLALCDEDRERIQVEGERLRALMAAQEPGAESLPYGQLDRSIVGSVEAPAAGGAIGARAVGASRGAKDRGRDREPIRDDVAPDPVDAPRRVRRKR